MINMMILLQKQFKAYFIIIMARQDSWLAPSHKYFYYWAQLQGPSSENTEKSYHAIISVILNHSCIKWFSQFLHI